MTVTAVRGRKRGVAHVLVEMPGPTPAWTPTLCGRSLSNPERLPWAHTAPEDRCAPCTSRLTDNDRPQERLMTATPPADLDATTVELLDTIEARLNAATNPDRWHWAGNTDSGEPYLATWTPGIGRCSVLAIGHEERSTSGAAADRVRAQAREFDLGDPDELVEQWATDSFGEPVRDPRLWFFEDYSAVDARERAVFEVAPGATTRSDPRVYRADIAGIRHPDAELIENAGRDLAALLGAVRSLQASNGALRAEVAPLRPAPAWDEEAVRGAFIDARLASALEVMADGYQSVCIRSNEEAADVALAVVRDHLPVIGMCARCSSPVVVPDGDPENCEQECCPSCVADLFKGRDAEVKAEALREAADWLADMDDGRDTGQHRAGRDIIARLRDRADRTAAEGGADRG